LPHNQVHDDIGGFMDDPRTAALDPIFWLHHCNIDRLWEIWRGKTTTPRDPTNPQWRTGVQFQLVGESGQTFKFVSQQALDTRTLLHGYVYDSVPPVVPPTQVAGAQSGAGSPLVRVAAEASAILTSMTAQRSAHLIAANDGSIELSAQPFEAHVRTIPLSTAVRERFSAGPTPHHYLRILNIRASGRVRSYRILIGLSNRKRVPIEIGTLSTFGIAAASDPQGDHADNGITKVFDITGALEALGLQEATTSGIVVLFEPIDRGELEEVPEGFLHADYLRAPATTISIGALQIFTE
jgi:tyrosinase